MEIDSLVEFYKEKRHIDDKINILCDLTFLKWLSKQKRDFNACDKLEEFLDVDTVELKTPKCIESLFDAWFLKTKRGKRREFMETVSLIVCQHLSNPPPRCFESHLKKYERCFVGSNDKGLYSKLQKTTTPVVTVQKKNLTLLFPKGSAKEEFRKWGNKEHDFVQKRGGKKRRTSLKQQSSQVRGKKKKKSTRGYFLNL